MNGNEVIITFNYVKDSYSLFLFCFQTLVEIQPKNVVGVELQFKISFVTRCQNQIFAKYVPSTINSSEVSSQMNRFMARVVFKCVQRNT